MGSAWLSTRTAMNTPWGAGAVRGSLARHPPDGPPGVFGRARTQPARPVRTESLANHSSRATVPQIGRVFATGKPGPLSDPGPGSRPRSALETEGRSAQNA